YWIPTTVLVMFAVTFAIPLLLRKYTISSVALKVVLAAFVISNISALPEQFRLTRSGHLQGYMALGPALLTEIKTLYNTPEGTPNGKEFDALKLAHTAGDFRAVLQNPLEFPNRPLDFFLFSSHFYNFLRSKRN